jgi:xylulose-5-phosphate/fructose-6-phosphate phosphoketolase
MFEFDAAISSAVISKARPTAPAAATPPTAGPLDPILLDRMDRYWNAANYLTIGQIYLRSNPLLREPLTPDHIKPRLLGHWGTSPGLSFVYVHLNRLIREHDANVIFLAGPGHGGPAVLANVYLEGTYSEIYPHVSQDAAGLQRLCRQFSTPGGVPSHVSVSTPGSIHEGGELGYVLAHAFGAAFDNPDLIVAAVVGDGEAKTGPLAGSWKSVSFLNAARAGAVLPILHLNGYKISGPTVWGRTSDADLRQRIEGDGYDVHFVEGDDPMRVHQLFAAALDICYARIRAIQERARRGAPDPDVRWPAIVLRTPKGWTGPKEVEGLPIEGTFRAHQVPLADVRSDPSKLARLDAWMRSYHPEALFDRCAPARHGRRPLRQPVHGRSADRLRLSRLSARDSRDRARPAAGVAVSRPRLQRAGNDDDAVHDGGAERDEPVSPCNGGNPPRAEVEGSGAGSDRRLSPRARGSAGLRARSSRGRPGDQPVGLAGVTRSGCVDA